MREGDECIDREGQKTWEEMEEKSNDEVLISASTRIKRP